MTNKAIKTPSIRTAQPKTKVHTSRRRSYSKPAEHGLDFIIKCERSALLYHVFGYAPDRPQNELDRDLFWIAKMIKERGDERIIGIELGELDAIYELDPKTIGKRQGIPRIPPRPELGELGAEIPPECFFLIQTDLTDGVYGFLTGLQWWVDIAGWILQAGTPHNKPPSITRHSRTAHSLLTSILQAYGSALKVSPGYDGGFGRDVRPVYELLRLYRAYTRYVGKLAQEIWPDVNWEPLLKLV